MDFALIEFTIDEMRYAGAEFSAFIESPIDALAGITPGDLLPIQGVAYDQAGTDDYVADPMIVFPPTNLGVVATVNEETRKFSLRVDLTQFAANAVIHIGLYGYVAPYNLTGGPGTDGPLTATDVLSSTFYGTLTRHYNDVVLPAVPTDYSTAARYLIIANAFSGGDLGHNRLIATFPELVGIPYIYSGLGGGEVYEAGWNWNGGTLAWTSGLTPPDNPNAFIIYTPNNPFIYTYWGSHGNTAGFEKNGMFGGGTGGLSINEGPATGLTTITTPPPAGVTTADMQGSDNKTYYVPTWIFANNRTATINAVGIASPNLWIAQAQHDMPAGAGHSFSWETADYPARPAMAALGTVTITCVNPFFFDDESPLNHFNHTRIGTITIVRSTAGPAAFTFTPEEVPPTDGTPDGNGLFGDGTAPGRTDNPQLRVWTFSLDGHDFYVLRLGDSLTLVYDVYSEQWMDWTDFNSSTWRAHCGLNWTGAEALADTYGSNVIAGDDAYGLLWFLDPEQPFDDNPLEGGDPSYFPRVTVGQVPMKGREVLPCYAVWLTTDMGDPAYSGAAVTLWTSDDAGETWDNQGYVRVTAGENSPEVSWYSLGQIEAPGRLFKIFDDGAVVRIDNLEMNDPDDKE